jgi:aspartyl-tRNA(Asn)/glutamyl-tRNA(Gln) amidotransferase subunit A
MSDITELSLVEMIVALRAGDFSSREITQEFLERSERLNPELNAYLTLTPGQALSQAEEADQRLQAWRENSETEIPPLLGVPIAVKDVLCVEDIRCTCGSRILENFVPPFSATAVERLLAAGVIILGKTNTDEFAMGSSTENSAYGPTRNPWDLERVPGGSSGGSAAAVAARMAPVALGTDTGGSVRQPASLCGVTGIKPTYGRVSRYGLVAYGSSLDVVGVLGRSVEDIAPLFTLMAGADGCDATTVEIPVPDIRLKGQIDFSRLRVGVPKEYFISGIQAEVEAKVREAIATLEGLGAEAREISLPHTKYALPVYYLIATAEASANLARYDGVRYGLRVPGNSLDEMYELTRAAGFGKEVKRRVLIGTYVLSAGYYDAYYLKAQRVRSLILRDFTQAFDKVDVILTPATPSAAFGIGEKADDPIAMYLNDVFTVPVNLAGLPGISVPAGLSVDGLPLGLQLIGRAFDEATLLKVGQVVEKAANFTAKPAGVGA